MKRKLIEVSHECLITCDNPACDFTVPYTEAGERNMDFWINEPCPKCGENLLTEKDYLQYKKVMKGVNWLNKWFSWTTYFVSKKRWNNRGTTSVHVHDGIKIKNEDRQP